MTGRAVSYSSDYEKDVKVHNGKALNTIRKNEKVK